MTTTLITIQLQDQIDKVVDNISHVDKATMEIAARLRANIPSAWLEPSSNSYKSELHAVVRNWEARDADFFRRQEAFGSYLLDSFESDLMDLIKIARNYDLDLSL